ncbi:efflux RND transporter permease subunit, partial [Staphylococcus epidermidis]|nr:efflux RND transporter permease subunit [Staphylococcus epidermidis]
VTWRACGRGGAASEQEVKLPDGYYFKFGGQFENMERAMGTLQVIVPLTIVAIFLLFLLFNSTSWPA